MHVMRVEAMYRVTDRLHIGRAAEVPGHKIALTVSAWLAELASAAPRLRTSHERVRR